MSEKLKDIELRSEEVQEVLSAVPNWMVRWGSLLFLSLILMVLALSWLVKYPDIIRSEAIITTELPPQKEYARITGAIDTVLVEDKQKVRDNQPLAIIENTANFKDVIYLKSVLDTIKLGVSDFYFPIDDFPVLFLGDIDASFALFENSYIQYRINKDLKPFQNEASSNKFTISELRSRISNLENQKEINEAELRFRESDRTRNKTLFQKGVISTSEYESKQLEFLQAQRNYKNISVSISQLKDAIASASNNLKSTEINSAREEMVLFKGVIQSFHQLKKAIQDWEMQYLLRSRVNGQVSFLDFWNQNQRVNQGDLVFTVIPTENSSYIAKLKTPALNSGKIQIGQRVNIKLENYPVAEFGSLLGTIDKISLTPDSDGFYLIDVALPAKLITSYNKEIEFKQEMGGIAEIVTEDLRLIERFFYQLRNVFER